MRFSLRESALPGPGPQGNFTSPPFQTLEGDVESMGGDTSKDQLLAAGANDEWTTITLSLTNHSAL